MIEADLFIDDITAFFKNQFEFRAEICTICSEFFHMIVTIKLRATRYKICTYTETVSSAL